MEFVTEFQQEFKNAKENYKKRKRELKFWERIRDNLNYAYLDGTIAFQISISLPLWFEFGEGNMKLLEKYANVYGYTVYKTKLLKDDCAVIAFVAKEEKTED